MNSFSCNILKVIVYYHRNKENHTQNLYLHKKKNCADIGFYTLYEDRLVILIKSDVISLLFSSCFFLPFR